MQDLDSRAIDNWIRSLLRHPSASCNKRKTFLHELKYLGVILHWYRNYVNAKFVVQITKRHREMVHYKVVKPRRQDYFVRPEHVRDWILWLKNEKKPVYWQLATFMVLTGTRVGEATGMLWDAIDLDEKTAKSISARCLGPLDYSLCATKLYANPRMPPVMGKSRRAEEPKSRRAEEPKSRLGSQSWKKPKQDL